MNLNGLREIFIFKTNNLSKDPTNNWSTNPSFSSGHNASFNEFEMPSSSYRRSNETPNISAEVLRVLLYLLQVKSSSSIFPWIKKKLGWFSLNEKFVGGSGRWVIFESMGAVDHAEEYLPAGAETILISDGD